MKMGSYRADELALKKVRNWQCTSDGYCTGDCSAAEIKRNAIRKDEIRCSILGNWRVPVGHKRVACPVFRLMQALLPLLHDKE